MPWFKVDDSIHAHPKFIDLPMSAIGLWTIAGAWSAQFLTDGLVNDRQLRRLGGEQEDIDALVDAGLWDATPDGYQFHDWDDYQPTRDDVESKRESDRERKRRQRRNPSGRFAESQQESARSHGGTPSGVTPESQQESRRESHRPDPTRPDPTIEDQNTRSPATPSSTFADRFEAFWQAYPRKVGKQKARAKFQAACKRANAEAITSGALRLAGDPNLPAERFIPHPTTWLERDGWEDGPLPERVTNRSAERARSGWQAMSGNSAPRNPWAVQDTEHLPELEEGEAS